MRICDIYGRPSLDDLAGIDSTMERLKSEASGMLDCPELQKHRVCSAYDQVASSTHGFAVRPPRSHRPRRALRPEPPLLVRQVQGQVVEDGGLCRNRGPSVHASPLSSLLIDLQVPEDTVLTDPTGLHLGAGPYFLLYSRALSEADEDARAPWHDSIKVRTLHASRTIWSGALTR